MARPYKYTQDKFGKRTSKTYFNPDGSREHWKTYTDGTPKKGPYKETTSGDFYNPYGRHVGKRKKR